jgi:hypothetical protein
MKLLAKVLALYPGGIYAGPIRAAFVWLHENLSIGARIKVSLRRHLGLVDERKTPPSLAEAYQLVSVVIALGRKAGDSLFISKLPREK